MGFAGNLQTLSLAEVVQTLNRINATGLLRLASADGGRDLVFDQGQLIGIGLRSGDDRQNLLRRLVAKGRVSGEDLAAISGRGGDAGATALVAAIVQRGLMSAADLEAALVEHAHDELFNLWTWDFADFVFHEMDDQEIDVAGTVDRNRKHPLTINLNSLLMESARRLDEWERLKQRFLDGGVVLGPAPGARGGIDRAGSEYPGSAVVPLIDAVRSVDDMVRDSVATRLEVYGVLAALIDARQLRPLSDEDLRRHADDLYGRANNARAGELYRKLLSRHPDDQDLTTRLAQCLEEVGDAPEAAGCYGQLAIGYLDKDQGEAALACAHKAVELSPADPLGHNVLVRCLVELGQSTEAVERLLHLAGLYRQLGRLEEARDTCLKCLAVDGACAEARRELARVFAVGGQEPGSEDQVLCVQCGEPNSRTGTVCASCRAPLHLTCMACQRVVSASDRMCVFCGADPHGGTRRHARGPIRGPSTTQVVNPSKVRSSGAHPDIVGPQGELDRRLHAARKAEQSGDLVGALAQWREVAALHPDNPEVHVHVRDLEARIHDHAIESQIERGHQLRRVRCFWRAMRCYRQAMRTMASDDPRAERLGEILANTARSHQMITLIYAGAAAFTLVFGFWVAKPWVDLRSFRRQVAEAGALLGEAGRVDVATLGLADGLFTGLEQDAGRFSGTFARRAQLDLLDAKGALILARQRVAERELAAVAALLDQGGLAEAEQKLIAYRTTVGVGVFSARLQELSARALALRARQAAVAQDAKAAPAALATAKEHEAAGRLGAALAGYRSVVEVAAVAVAAREGIARLIEQEKRFTADWMALKELAVGDVNKASERHGGIATAAATWGLIDEYTALGRDLARRSAAAKAEWPAADRGGELGVLRDFIKRHPGTAEAVQARNRLAQVENQTKTRDQALVSHRDLLARGEHELAFQSGKGLLRNFAGRLAVGDVLLPLVVTSTTPGARLLVDGVERGVLPQTVVYDAQRPLLLEVRAAGYRAATRSGADLVSDWRWQPALLREARWLVKPGQPAAQPISHVQTLSDGGVLAMVGEQAVRFDAAGRERWRHRLVAPGEGLVRLPPAASEIADGRLILAHGDRGVVVIGGDGAVAAHHPTTAALVGPPVVFVNQLLGAQPRLAVAAPGLASGPFSGPLSARPAAGTAVAGPLVLRTDLDCALLVATVDGHLVAVEDGGGGRQLWRADVTAHQIGALVATGDGGVLAVVDGNRLECWDATPAAGRRRWVARLSADAVGASLVTAGEVWVAAGPAIVRRRLDGTELPPLALPSPAGCAVGGAGDLAAAGCLGGELVVFKKGVFAWVTPTPAPVTAVAVANGLVVAGCSDGSLLVFAP